MALVDYAASSDSEPDSDEEKNRKSILIEENSKMIIEESKSSDTPNQNAITSLSSANQLSPENETKLPDASLLFSSSFQLNNQTLMNDHSSTVSAALAAQKRDSNGSGSTNQRTNKVPRSNKPHSRNIPDMAGGSLIPPQLRGRSNVVTEDITKLFVRKDGQKSS